MLRRFSSQPKGHFQKTFTAKADPIYMDVTAFSPPKSNEEARKLYPADVTLCRMDKASRFWIDKL